MLLSKIPIRIKNILSCLSISLSTVIPFGIYSSKANDPLSLNDLLTAEGHLLSFPILSYMNEEDFRVMSQVSKQWNQAIEKWITNPSFFDDLTLQLEESASKLPIHDVQRETVGNPVGQYQIDDRLFALQNVSGKSFRCFFNALGLKVKKEIHKLSRHVKDPIVRHMLANEIVSAAATPDQLTNLVKAALHFTQYEAQMEEINHQEILRSEFLKKQSSNPEVQNLDTLPPELRKEEIEKRRQCIEKDLKQRALNCETFKAFLKSHIDDAKMMVFIPDHKEGNVMANYTSVDAIAYVNDLGLKIYRPDNSQKLRLAHQFIPRQAKKIAYLYHEGSHFQALTLLSQKVEPIVLKDLAEPIHFNGQSFSDDYFGSEISCFLSDQPMSSKKERSPFKKEEMHLKENYASSSNNLSSNTNIQAYRDGTQRNINDFFKVEGYLLSVPILSYMTEKDFCLISQVCKQWNQTIEESYGRDTLTRRLVIRIKKMTTGEDPFFMLKSQFEHEKEKMKVNEEITPLLNEFISRIIPPQSKLRMGYEGTIRSEFADNPHLDHNFFSHLRKHIKAIKSYKKRLKTHPFPHLINSLVSEYERFMENLVFQTNAYKTNNRERDKLYRVPPILVGERIGSCSLDFDLAYKLANRIDPYDAHPPTEGSSSPVNGVKGVHFKVNNEGLLFPGMEKAIYNFYQLFVGGGITPTLLMVLKRLPIVPNDTSSNLQSLGNVGDKAAEDPEIEKKLQEKIKPSMYCVQASLTIEGKRIDQFLEEIDAGESSYDQLNRKSFSGHILASLLTNPFDYHARNLMVDEQGQIIGIDNDDTFKPGEMKGGTPIVRNILYFLPLMTEPISQSITDKVLLHFPPIFLLDWLTSLNKQNKFYESLLKQKIIPNKPTFRDNFHLPIKLQEGVVTYIFNQLTKMQDYLRNGPITHQNLFALLQPLAHRYYEGIAQLRLPRRHKDDEELLLPKTPLEKIITLYNNQTLLVDMLKNSEKNEDKELLKQLNLQPSLSKGNSLTIDQAIAELLALVDLRKYDFSQTLYFMEEVIRKTNVLKIALHESWKDPSLLLSLVGQGASPLLIEIFCQLLGSVAIKDPTSHRSFLHMAIQCGRTSRALEQIETLIRLGANIEAPDQWYRTPLEAAIDDEANQLVDQLILLGAGANASLIKLKKHHDKLLKKGQSFSPNVFKRLEQTNPLIGWHLALDAVLPPNLDEQLLETVSKGNRVVSETFIEQMFEENGTIKKPNVHGKRPVHMLNNHNRSLYIKFNPELPGLEEAVSLLMRQIVKFVAPYNELGRLKGHPVLLSQAISGDTLFDVLKTNPQLLQKLDSAYLSALLVMTMLINPEDGNPTNYIVSPFTTSDNKTSYRIVAIDNDHAFMPAVATEIREGWFGKKPSLQVKTILYCLDQMRDSIHPDVVKQLKNLDIYQTLKKWLEDLDTYDKQIKPFFKGKGIESKETVIGVPFAKGMIKNLYTKMSILQRMLNKEKLPTHLELLYELEPALGLRYGPVALEDISVWNRFVKIDGHFYNRPPHTAASISSSPPIGIQTPLTIMSTASLSQVLESSELPDKETLQKQLWSNEYGPEKALEKLEKIHKKANFYKEIIEELRKQLPEKLKSLEIESAEQLLMYYIDLRKIEVPHQRTLLNSLSGKALRRVNLINCKALVHSYLNNNWLNLSLVTKLNLQGCTQLTRFSEYNLLKGFPPFKLPHLVYLNLGGCTALRELKLQAENLLTLNLTGCTLILDEMLDRVVKHSPKLRNIDLTGCAGVSYPEARRLFPNYPFRSLNYVSTVDRASILKAVVEKEEIITFISPVATLGDNIIDLINRFSWISKICISNSSVSIDYLKKLFLLSNLKYLDLGSHNAREFQRPILESQEVIENNFYLYAVLEAFQSGFVPLATKLASEINFSLIIHKEETFLHALISIILDIKNRRNVLKINPSEFSNFIDAIDLECSTPWLFGLRDNPKYPAYLDYLDRDYYTAEGRIDSLLKKSPTLPIEIQQILQRIRNEIIRVKTQRTALLYVDLKTQLKTVAKKHPKKMMEKVLSHSSPKHCKKCQGNFYGAILKSLADDSPVLSARLLHRLLHDWARGHYERAHGYAVGLSGRSSSTEIVTYYGTEKLPNLYKLIDLLHMSFSATYTNERNRLSAIFKLLPLIEDIPQALWISGFIKAEHQELPETKQAAIKLKKYGKKLLDMANQFQPNLLENDKETDGVNNYLSKVAQIVLSLKYCQIDFMGQQKAMEQ